MKITELAIPDVTNENINKSKNDLADKIVNSLLPLIQPQISKKIKELKLLQKSIKEKVNLISNERNTLKDLQKEYDKRKNINLLLNRVEQLLNLGLDNTLRSEMINMLRKINDLPKEKIDFYLDETLRIITRKFSKIEKE